MKLIGKSLSKVRSPPNSERYVDISIQPTNVTLQVGQSLLTEKYVNSHSSSFLVARAVSNMNSNNALNTFTNTILNALDKSSKPNFNHQRKRIPPDIRNLFKNRNKIRRAWQISKDPALKTAKNKIHDIIKRKMKKLNDANWSNITKDLSSNSNSLWRKVADLLKTTRTLSMDVPNACSSSRNGSPQNSSKVFVNNSRTVVPMLLPEAEVCLEISEVSAAKDKQEIVELIMKYVVEVNRMIDINFCKPKEAIIAARAREET
ncbi:hypothetical protein CDAR_2231 [Caerostris darwini]|uniref:Uncharacterized protein n=1 Tax=Caerostris darwini TaxID=1538125 RepID=A0AAV4N991_9ARAC|nr:hypothetical protein CDAR_2231 [Caerostris darwini]